MTEDERMKQLRQRKRKPAKFHISWFGLLLVAIIVYFSSILVSQQAHLHQLDSDQAEAEARLETARRENAQLKQEKEDLGRLDYIEKIAREELGMTRHGELPYSTGAKDAGNANEKSR